MIPHLVDCRVFTYRAPIDVSTNPTDHIEATEIRVVKTSVVIPDITLIQTVVIFGIDI